MTRAEAILAAVERIHEAPLTAEGWTRALGPIAAIAGADQATLIDLNKARPATEFIAGLQQSPQQLAAIAAAFGAGLFPCWMKALPTGMMVRTSAMQRDGEFSRSVFYNEALRPMGTYYGITGAPVRTPHRDIYLGLGRSLGREDFHAEDAEALQALVPHIVTALRVRDRLAAADLRAAGACAALDRLDAGVMLVDAAAGIVFANPVAELILAGNDGLRTGKEGLRACDSRAARALGRLIAGCADISLADGGPGGTIAVPRSEGNTPLRVVVAPFRPETAQLHLAWLGAARPVAIVLVTDPDADRRCRTDRLRERFGLTAAESKVALEIVKGEGRRAAGARLRLSETTVRNHLTSIFEKTGVRRQAELVGLVFNENQTSTDGGD